MYCAGLQDAWLYYLQWCSLIRAHLSMCDINMTVIRSFWLIF